MPVATMGGPQSSPCPTPVMQGHSHTTGPKPWSDGKLKYKCVLLADATVSFNTLDSLLKQHQSLSDVW